MVLSTFKVRRFSRSGNESFVDQPCYGPRPVILVALSGGIGSGKSSVSALLAEKGAVIIDADAVAKELQEPGAEVFIKMVERFGDEIVGPDGRLDRPKIAEIVFNDKQALKDLNKIAHPTVRRVMADRADDQAQTDKVVVVDTPLLDESTNTRRDWDGVIIVDLPPELAVERLIAHRGFNESDAWARINNQQTREERLEGADFVVDNSGTPDDLPAKVDELWALIAQLPGQP